VDRGLGSAAVGAPKGSKDKKVIERETIAAEIRAGRIAAGIAMPLMATEKLEMLLSIALRHMEESRAAENVEEYAAWYDRAVVLARSLAPYQTPQLRAIAVAHTGMKPAPVSLDRLNDKQLETLRELLRLMGPTNVALEPPKG
jgi:hypothetical protein